MNLPILLSLYTSINKFMILFMSILLYSILVIYLKNETKKKIKLIALIFLYLFFLL